MQSRRIHVGPCIAEKLFQQLKPTERWDSPWLTYRLPSGQRIGIGTETVYWFPKITVGAVSLETILESLEDKSHG